MVFNRDINFQVSAPETNRIISFSLNLFIFKQRYYLVMRNSLFSFSILFMN